MNPDDEYMICYVEGVFEYRRIAQRRLMQDHDFKIREKPIPELHPGEILSVVPGQSMYRIIKHK